jgi:hypothetical protein
MLLLRLRCLLCFCLFSAVRVVPAVLFGLVPGGRVALPMLKFVFTGRLLSDARAALHAAATFQWCDAIIK